MIYNNHYLNKLYNDLVTNSPKTISMNIPSDIGQGKIVQTKIKHGIVLSNWQMCYKSDMNVQGPVSKEYMQIIFCLNDGISWGGVMDERRSVTIQKNESCISYLDMASFIKSNGARPKDDLIELWKRIVFNMAVTNTDDHLRNHAFIFTREGWVLSPMYDVNPVPYGDELSLNVDEEDNRISLELAISVAPRFGIEEKKASEYAERIVSTVKTDWVALAKKYGLTRRQIEEMEPAFRLN